jgi:hypothetical protein
LIDAARISRAKVMLVVETSKSLVVAFTDLRKIRISSVTGEVFIKS